MSGRRATIHRKPARRFAPYAIAALVLLLTIGSALFVWYAYPLEVAAALFVFAALAPLVVVAVGLVVVAVAIIAAGVFAGRRIDRSATS
jgi:hypothetical protein